MESFWPQVEAGPKISPDDLEIARLVNRTGKIVFSRTLDSVRETASWRNVKLRHKVDPVEIRRLKEMPGKDIWLGTSNLAVSFIKEDLIHEFRFMINPIIIGRGTRIFHEMSSRLNLELTETRKFDSGNVLLFYRPAK